MPKTVEEVVAGLRDDLTRWRSEVAMIELLGASVLAGELKKWLDSGERALNRHKIRRDLLGKP